MIDYKYGEVIYKKSGTIDTLRTGHHGISSANGKQLLEFLEPKNFVLSSNGPLRQLSYSYMQTSTIPQLTKLLKM